MGNSDQTRISYFADSVINEIAPPERFTFPFYYEPHPLTKIGAAEPQHYLETQTDLDHNFGLGSDKEKSVIGKMFGVLVVRDREGKLGYLSAFSGKLANSKNIPITEEYLIDRRARLSNGSNGLPSSEYMGASRPGNTNAPKKTQTSQNVCNILPNFT